MITYKDLQVSSWCPELYTFHADVEPKKSIRIYGESRNTQGYIPFKFDRTFKPGDRVIYDSYNLTYTGTIISIGKTVTVKDGSTVKRLSLYDFTHYNFNLNLDEVKRHNDIEMMSI